MSDEAKRFRQRAFDCRELAKGTRDPRDEQLLVEIADELDQEADRIDAESDTTPSGD